MGEPKKPWEGRWEYWSAPEDGSGFVMDLGTPTREILFVRNTHCPDGVLTLAAAAPDLYRALASLLENPVLVESWGDVQEARAALRKARGE